jgi:hypothetical protein
MAKDFQVIHLTVDEARLKGASNRLRNQFVGCMHAHNELTILNRLLMFTMNDTGDGERTILRSRRRCGAYCKSWRQSCSRRGRCSPSGSYSQTRPMWWRAFNRRNKTACNG